MPRGAREMNRLYRSGKYRLLRKTASSKIGPLPLLISLIGGAQSSSTPLPIPLPQRARGKKTLNSLASYWKTNSPDSNLSWATLNLSFPDRPYRAAAMPW